MRDLGRVESGVAGLDRVLGGGFVEGASYIFQGRPGAGKTILSNQIAFARAALGEKVLYVTLLSESHDRLFQNLSTLKFFDHSRVGQNVIYLSAFSTLRDEGLGAVVQLLRTEIRRHDAQLLVFDGLLNARDRADNNLDVKTFVAELQGQAAFARCTTLFLTSTELDDASPEHTMVDGVVDLSEDLVGVRGIRRLQVRKARGSAMIGGLHQYEISDRGITVYPRLEAAIQRQWFDAPGLEHRLSSGCADLDELIHGGFPAGSLTLASGPTGTGKTTLGLHFLSAASAEEPGLHFGFFETPQRLAQKAQNLGIQLPGPDVLDLLWHPMGENLLDKLGSQLLEHVEARKVRRLVIDGMGGFSRAAATPQRLTEFFATLINRLRDMEVTTLATWELREPLTSVAGAPVEPLSALHDNLILLRRVERGHDLHRTISIQKMRDSDFNTSTHALRFTSRGLTLVSPSQWDPEGIAREVGSI